MPIVCPVSRAETSRGHGAKTDGAEEKLAERVQEISGDQPRRPHRAVRQRALRRPRSDEKTDREEQVTARHFRREQRRGAAPLEREPERGDDRCEPDDEERFHGAFHSASDHRGRPRISSRKMRSPANPLPALFSKYRAGEI